MSCQRTLGQPARRIVVDGRQRPATVAGTIRNWKRSTSRSSSGSSEWWEAAYEATPKTEPRRFHLLSGAIFPIYDKVMGASGIQSVKIARAVLADGQALVGLNLSADGCTQCQTASGHWHAARFGFAGGDFGIGGWRRAHRTRQWLAADCLADRRRRGVGTGPQRRPGQSPRAAVYGLAEEIIQFRRRWFVVLEDATVVLSQLLAKRKAVKDLTVESAEAK